MCINILVSRGRETKQRKEGGAGGSRGDGESGKGLALRGNRESKVSPMSGIPADKALADGETAFR